MLTNNGLNYRGCEVLMRKLVRDKDRNQVSDRVLDASLSSNPKCKSTCETCALRPSALTADRRIVPELLPESDKEFFDPQFDADYLHDTDPMPSKRPFEHLYSKYTYMTTLKENTVMMAGEIKIARIIDYETAVRVFTCVGCFFGSLFNKRIGERQTLKMKIKNKKFPARNKLIDSSSSLRCKRMSFTIQCPTEEWTRSPMKACTRISSTASTKRQYT